MLSLKEMDDLLLFLSETLVWYKEFSIELHPALLSYELLDILNVRWIDRISFWIQTLDERILQEHTRVDVNYEKLWEYLFYAKKLWIKKINFDFIYDLIGDTIQNINDNFSFINTYQPTSVNYYPLRILTSFLKKKYKFSEKRRVVFYKYILYQFKKTVYTRKNNAIYCLEGFKWGENFLYEEIIYSHNHILYGLWVSAVSHIWKQFQKNIITYSDYQKCILNWKLPSNLTFNLSNIPFLLYRFYYLLLMHNNISLNLFDKRYGRGSLSKIKLYIDELINHDLLIKTTEIIQVTEKGVYYFETIENILFQNFSQEINLLRKL